MLGSNPVSIDEFRTKLSEYIGRVVYGRDKIVIKKYNREAAVLLSIDEYESLRDPRKRFSSKKEWDKFFVRLDKIRNRMSETDQKELGKILNEEVQSVRSSRSKNAV